jgi:hypothetical protein
MGDDIDDEDAMVLNAKSPADVVAMIRLGEYEDGTGVGQSWPRKPTKRCVPRPIPSPAVTGSGEIFVSKLPSYIG